MEFSKMYVRVLIDKFVRHYEFRKLMGRPQMLLVVTVGDSLEA